MRRESFEHFYLSKVALGEGCGCAEHVTRIREIDSYAASRARARHGQRASSRRSSPCWRACSGAAPGNV